MYAAEYTRPQLTFLALRLEEDTNPEVTIRPPSTPAPPIDDPILPLCPPKPVFKENSRKNLLLVSTLDGQISALDLNKEKHHFIKIIKLVI